MHRYALGSDAVNVNKVTVFTRGIFDVTRLLGGPLCTSLPGFLHGDPSLYKELKLKEPRQKKYGSYVSILLHISVFVYNEECFLDKREKPKRTDTIKPHCPD